MEKYLLVCDTFVKRIEPSDDIVKAVNRAEEIAKEEHKDVKIYKFIEIVEP